MACGLPFKVKAAERAQRLLSRKIVLKPLVPEPQVVAGLDASYATIEGVEVGIGVAVLVEWSSSLRVSRCSVYLGRVCVPYVPGFLAFRELAVMVPAFNPLKDKADLVVVDGHGISHPRRFGIASHVGVIYNLPSVGVAKRRLAGREVEKEGRTYVVLGDEVVGIVIKKGSTKLYVSPGHLIDLETAFTIVERITVKKLPEPTYRADEVSKIVKSALKRSVILAPPSYLETCIIRVGNNARIPPESVKVLRKLGFEVIKG
ncbi:MAG: endonuclease V [Desulfurococcales archaeon]|nr:endonuclease V [Desulfurococcales archaeon]